MIKKLMSAVLVAISLVAIPATAQKSPTPDSAKGKDAKERCEKRKDCDLKKENARNFKDRKRGDRPVRDRYEGMILTDAQRAELAQLDSVQMARRSSKAAEWRSRKRDQASIEKDNKVKAKDLTPEQRRELKEERKLERREKAEQMRSESKAERREYLAKVKDIVGPEQYVIFLENEYVNVAPAPGHKDFRQGPRQAHSKDMKGDRKHASKDSKKKDRGNKNAANDNAKKGNK